LDLSAALEAPLVIPASGHASVPTGLAIALPEGYEGQVRPRSGLAARHAVTILNAPGTIDQDYRGEVRVLLVNLGVDAYQINPGDRIAQLVVAPVTRVSVQVVEDSESLGATERGSGGFGSTGS
jgi:dUTP pyrophosphatase